MIKEYQHIPIIISPQKVQQPRIAENTKTKSIYRFKNVNADQKAMGVSFVDIKSFNTSRAYNQEVNLASDLLNKSGIN